MIKTGLDKFIEECNNFKGRNIALLVNQSSITSDLIYSWDALRKKGLGIKKIFSPEHGLFSTEQDQVPVTKQPGINLDVASLYRDTFDSLVPGESLLHDINTVIFDVQDVGTRYYTYINTMVYFMKTLNRSDIEFIVLDRPNPLGGLEVEGPVLEDEFKSFVGEMPVPVRHGLTAGEISIMAKDIYNLDIDLKIFKMLNWKRENLYHDTGLTWVPPSPNMPTLNTVELYSGACLFEGLNVSEGRGTTVPFEVIGAPFINSYELADYLNSQKLEGVYFRPHFFIPVFHKYSDEINNGIYIHITDRKKFKPFLTGIAIVKSINDLYPDLKFLNDTYEFTTSHPIFDLLCGNSVIRKKILSGETVESIENSWKKQETEFLETKEQYHLY